MKNKELELISVLIFLITEILSLTVQIRGSPCLPSRFDDESIHFEVLIFLIGLVKQQASVLVFWLKTRWP